jgi:hypothetical protein
MTKELDYISQLISKTKLEIKYETKIKPKKDEAYLALIEIELETLNSIKALVTESALISALKEIESNKFIISALKAKALKAKVEFLKLKEQ